MSKSAGSGLLIFPISLFRWGIFPFAVFIQKLGFNKLVYE